MKEGMFLIESVKSRPRVRNPVVYERLWLNPRIRPTFDAIQPQPTKMVFGMSWIFHNADGSKTEHVIGITDQAKEQLGPLYEVYKSFESESTYLRGKIASLGLNVDRYRAQEKKLEGLSFWERLKLLFTGWSMADNWGTYDD
jgi:glycine cleavage system H lipoate-binding protein